MTAPAAHCALCGADLVAARPNAGLDSPGRVRIGRPPTYCSDRCRLRAHRDRARRESAEPARSREAVRLREAAEAVTRAAARLAAAASARPPDAETAARIAAVMTAQAAELAHLAGTLER